MCSEWSRNSTGTWWRKPAFGCSAQSPYLLPLHRHAAPPGEQNRTWALGVLTKFGVLQRNQLRTKSWHRKRDEPEHLQWRAACTYTLLKGLSKDSAATQRGWLSKDGEIWAFMKTTTTKNPEWMKYFKYQIYEPIMILPKSQIKKKPNWLFLVNSQLILINGKYWERFFFKLCTPYLWVSICW